MITAKVFGFYGVVLSSVEVVLKLRAVGAIAPFFSLFSFGKHSDRMQSALNAAPELQWLFDRMEGLAESLYDAYEAMFNNDKSQLLYTVGYNGIYAGIAAVDAFGKGAIGQQDDIFAYLRDNFDLRSLYFEVCFLFWSNQGYHSDMDRFLMNTDGLSQQFLPLVSHNCSGERNAAVIKAFMLEYVQAMILLGGFVGDPRVPRHTDIF